MTCCLRDWFFFFLIIYVLFVKESLLLRDTDNELVGLVMHILKILLWSENVNNTGPLRFDWLLVLIEETVGPVFCFCRFKICFVVLECGLRHLATVCLSPWCWNIQTLFLPWWSGLIFLPCLGVSACAWGDCKSPRRMCWCLCNRLDAK